MTGERMVHVNGVKICAEGFGDPAEPTVLLIHGATASMMAWEDDFCRRLMSGGRFVIRYDHRDTGRSVSYPPGSPPYSMRDLMEDAIGLMDAFGVEKGHLVGRSMGGGIAALAALEYPDRVRSLTLMASSPGGSDLSPPAEEFVAYVKKGHPEWSDREAVIEYVVGLLRVFDGGTPAFNAEAIRESVTREIDRTVNVASSQTNHFRIALGEPIRSRLDEIRAPTLVIHGEADPIFPLDHGRAWAREIPGARIVILPGTGHLLLSATWHSSIPELLTHTAAA